MSSQKILKSMTTKINRTILLCSTARNIMSPENIKARVKTVNIALRVFKTVFTRNITDYEFLPGGKNHLKIGYHNTGDGL